MTSVLQFLTHLLVHALSHSLTFSFIHRIRRTQGFWRTPERQKTILGVEDYALVGGTKPTQQKQRVTTNQVGGIKCLVPRVREVPEEFRVPPPPPRVSWPVKGVLRKRRWNLVSEIKTGFVVVAVFSGDRRVAGLHLSKRKMMSQTVEKAEMNRLY